MSSIKNGQISLYFYFNKIIKGPGTSFRVSTEPETLEIFFIQLTSI